MAENTCIYFSRGCFFGKKNACTEEETGKCGEGIRRRLLAQQPCPVMVSLGYSGSAAECDDPDLRAQVPEGKPCHINGKCIREISPTVQKLYGKKEQYAGLIKPIRETLNALQI